MSERQQLIDCIARDESTLRDPRFVPIPGCDESFYRDRINGYREILASMGERQPCSPCRFVLARNDHTRREWRCEFCERQIGYNTPRDDAPVEPSTMIEPVSCGQLGLFD
jgi:hypothetical protein